MYSLLFAFATTLLLTSCGDDIDENTADVTEPVVSTAPLTGTINGYKYVDLGIRKSMYDTSIAPGSEADRRIVFATCNIGAKSPSDIGYYFRWGDLLGWKVNVDADGYTITSATQYDKNGNAKSTLSSSPFFGQTYGLTDQTAEDFQNKTNLTSNSTTYGDAATYNWGSEWTMINLNQQKMLGRLNLYNDVAKNTIGSGTNSVVITYTWMSSNSKYGVAGMELKNESLGTSVFFPVSGYCRGRYRHIDDVNGYYWTTTPYDNFDANAMNFNSSDFSWFEYSRSDGRVVRPIAEIK